ncbi:MAG: type IX secretion system membrane protein PorP/SprF [Saprospiraceae bacterium]
MLLCSFYNPFKVRNKVLYSPIISLNPILVNPAVAGFDDMHKLQMNIRNQWTGFPESPKSYHIGYTWPNR